MSLDVRAFRPDEPALLNNYLQPPKPSRLYYFIWSLHPPLIVPSQLIEVLVLGISSSHRRRVMTQLQKISIQTLANVDAAVNDPTRKPYSVSWCFVFPLYLHATGPTCTVGRTPIPYGHCKHVINLRTGTNYTDSNPGIYWACTPVRTCI